MHPIGRRLLGLTLALLCLSMAVFLWWNATGKNLLTGHYLHTDNGAHIVIDPRGTPTVLRDLTSRRTLFEGLEDGDQILVVSDGIAESYPGRSGAYWCLRLRRGGSGDLPADALCQLAELGWVSYPL